MHINALRPQNISTAQVHSTSNILKNADDCIRERAAECLFCFEIWALHKCNDAKNVMCTSNQEVQAESTLQAPKIHQAQCPTVLADANLPGVGLTQEAKLVSVPSPAHHLPGYQDVQQAEH